MKTEVLRTGPRSTYDRDQVSVNVRAPYSVYCEKKQLEISTPLNYFTLVYGCRR